jgi:RNA polymerase sigma factor (sigma-70 family)
VTRSDWQTEEFERHRQHLESVAYRMLGSRSEAEDAVQEAWLRLSRSDTEAVENLAGWLTTVVARVSLDLLRSRRARREDYVGSWLPEPIVSIENGPEDEAVLADSVGLALLVLLDTLTPAERLAFVLHDMFGMPFDEIAPIVDRSEAATRQLASRARQRFGEPPRPPTRTSSSGSTSAAWRLLRARRSRAQKQSQLRCFSAEAGLPPTRARQS